MSSLRRRHGPFPLSHIDDAATPTSRASRRTRAPASPIALAFRVRVTRRCTMLRPGASPSAPIPAHRPPHFRQRDCRRHCRRCRPSARHGASHQCPRSRRRGRPLTRRGGSPPPGSPASISPSCMLSLPALSRRRSRYFVTPHAPGAQSAHAWPGEPSRCHKAPDGAYSMMGTCSALCVTDKPLESLYVFLSCSPCMLTEYRPHCVPLRPGTDEIRDCRPRAGRPMDRETAPWPSETTRQRSARRRRFGLEHGR